MKEALLADAIGTTAGAVGTSTVTTYVESAAGIAEGGRLTTCCYRRTIYRSFIVCSHIPVGSKCSYYRSFGDGWCIHDGFDP